MFGKNNADDRGQMLLIAALILAITLVLLVTILNAVLFAGNLSSDSPSPEVEGVEEYQHVAHSDAGKSILSANYDHDTYSDRESAVEADVEMMGDAMFEQTTAARSQFVDLEYEGATQGTMVRQDETAEFISEGEENETVMTNPEDIRQFQIVADADDNDGLGTDEFRIIIDEGGDEWEVTVTQTPAGELEVETDDGSFTAEEIEYDITTGQINGEYNEMEFGPDSEDIEEVKFERDSGFVDLEDGNLVGEYVIVGKDPASATGAGSGTVKEGANSVVYSADITLNYDSPSLSYEETITVEPCATDAGSCPAVAHPAWPETEDGEGDGEGDFQVTITDYDDEVEETETVSFDIELDNTGEKGSQEVTLTIDGSDYNNEVVDSETIELESGENKEIELQWPTDEGDGSGGQGEEYTATVETENDYEEVDVVVEQQTGPGN